MLRRRSPEDFNETVNRLYPDATASSRPRYAPAAPPTHRPESPTDEFGNSFPDSEDTSTLGTRGTARVQRGLDRAWEHLGVSPEARKDTVDKVLSEWMPQGGMVDLVKQRKKDGAWQVQKEHQGKSEAIVQDDGESVHSIIVDSSQEGHPGSDGFWVRDSTRAAPTDPYELLGGNLSEDSGLHKVGKWFHILTKLYGLRSLTSKIPEDRRRAAYTYREMTKAYKRIIEDDYDGIYPDLHDHNEDVQKLLNLARPGSRKPEPQKMYMHYTISQDRSGNSDAVSAGLLAVLGERSRTRETVLAALGERETKKEARFKNASLALLSRGGR